MYLFFIIREIKIYLFIFFIYLKNHSLNFKFFFDFVYICWQKLRNKLMNLYIYVFHLLR